MGSVDDDDFRNIRIRSRLHEKVTRWSFHWLFSAIVMLTIGANSITLAVGTVDGLSNASQNTLSVLENLFLAVYQLEFIIKMYVSPTAYFTNGFNLFDFMVLIVSWVDLITTLTSSGAQSAALSGLRILRILRTLRTLRTVSFVPSLQVIVTALMVTFGTYMLNLMVILFLIMFIFGVMAYYLYGATTDTFGSLGQSMLALFTMVTTDNWMEIEATIDSYASAQWFCVIFIFIGSYVFTNVFVSIVIINLNDATQAYINADRAERRKIVASKTITMNQKQKEEAISFRMFLEQDRRAKFANYQQLMKSVNNLLKNAEKPNEKIFCGDTSLNLLFVNQFLTVLDQVDNVTFIQKNLHRELSNLISLVVEKQLAENGVGDDLLRKQAAGVS